MSKRVDACAVNMLIHDADIKHADSCGNYQLAFEYSSLQYSPSVARHRLLAWSCNCLVRAVALFALRRIPRDGDCASLSS